MSFWEVVVLLHGFDSLRWFQQCLSLGDCEEVCDVVCHSNTDRTFGIHTCPYDVLVSYKHDTTYDVSQYPSSFGDLFLFCNSGHEASSCDPEQHKQFCPLGGGLLCLSPVPSLLSVSFAVTSVTKDEVRLGFGGSFVPFGGFFLFALVSVTFATAPANPGSFLIAACRLTNLAGSSRPGFFPFSLMEYDTSAPLVGQSTSE